MVKENIMAKTTYTAKYTAEEMELLLDKGMKFFKINLDNETETIEPEKESNESEEV
jgi:hypothetical protein